MIEEYKPSNYFVFWNAKKTNIFLMFVPLLFAILKVFFVENDFLGQLIFYLSICGCIFLILPIYRSYINGKVKYRIYDEYIEIYSLKKTKIVMKTLYYKDIKVELKSEDFVPYLVLVENKFRPTKTYLYLKDKEQCLELYKFLQQYAQVI